MMLRGGDADIMKMGKDKDMLRQVNKTQGLFTWREEDPSTWNILAPYVFCIRFTCKQLRGRKNLAPCKLPSLGRSKYLGQTRRGWRRAVQMLITAIKDWPFRLALLRTDYCNNSAKSQLLTSVTRAEGPKLYFSHSRPPIYRHL